MEKITVSHGGKDFTFRADVELDEDHGAPWEECDGHGPVSDWTARAKRPGEIILIESRGKRRFYDYAEACRIAQRDGWNAPPYDVPGETAKQRAARAACADFEYMRAWCNGEWHYVGLIVTLLDEHGGETDICDHIWGIESSETDYVREEARRLAEDLARGFGIRWGAVSRKTYGFYTGE